MLELSDKDLIAKGDMRGCYQHPDDSGLCVKVDQSHTHKPATLHEITFFERVFRWRNRPKFKAVAQFHGRVETNLGIGIIFELVRDETTGKISDTFHNLLMQDTDATHEAEYDKALQLFRADFLEDAIVARDLRPWNICAQRLESGEIKLRLIDGMGHRYFLPLCDIFPPIARRIISKHLKKRAFMNVKEMKARYLNDRSNKWAPGDKA